MVRHQADDLVLGMLDVAEVPGTVQRVEAGRGQLGGVPDVMEDGGRREQFRLLRQNRAETASLARHALRVRPPAGEREQQTFGDASRPCRLIHAQHATCLPANPQGEDPTSLGFSSLAGSGHNS
jgi:hypothetical protein